VFGSQQSENNVLPFGDVNPSGHDVQDEAPLSEYVFSGHVTHVAVPDAFLNFPASHAGHGPPFGPVYPGLQEQWLTLVLPTDEFEFAGQLVHAALPFVGLYVPGGHIAHSPLGSPAYTRYGPVYPVLHEQAIVHTGVAPYTSTSGNCRYSDVTDILRNRADPTHV
jgi:hypothetical protein